MSVGQKPDELNSDSEEAGDAFMAWAVLSTKLDTLPDWARAYFEKVLEQIDEFDPHDDEEIALTCGLEIPVIRSKPRKLLGAKSKHDYAQVFDWIDMWHREADVDLEAALVKYIEIFDLEDGYETIKSAYYKVRRARLASMDQDRPHFTKAE